MALDVNSALLKLNPITPIGLDLPNKKQASMERERLKLAREQFEEVKRQNVQDAEWRKIAEAGEMTRAQMASDRQAEHDQQVAQAETMAQRRAAYDSMVKRLDTSDFEGMEADATRLNELGGLAERTGEDQNGFPAWRLGLDAEAERAKEQAQDERAATRGPNETPPESLGRMNALGYDTLGLRDSQPETAPGAAAPLSTEDAFRAAQRATRAPDEAPAAAPDAPPEDTGVSAYDYAGEQDAAKDFAEPGRSTPMAPPPGLEPSIFQATGRPARPAARADIMGSVPKDTIDTGAMQAQRKRRLGPVMDNLVKGMPQAYQAETQANNDAALAMGLPADKTAEASLKFRAPAETALRDERDNEAKQRETQAKIAADAALDPVEQQKLIKYGRDAAKGSFTQNAIKERLGTIEAVKTVEQLLNDDHPENDDYAINFLMRLAEQKGAQSDKDAMRMDGISAASTPEQIKAWINRHIEGGTYQPFKDSMMAFASRQREKERADVFSWMESEQAHADKAEHPLEAKGRNEVIESLPEWIRKEYNDSLDPEEPAHGGTDAAPAPGATQGAGAATLEPGENPIPKSSRIAYEHNNPGNLIFDKDNPAGGEPGEDKEGGGKWARFPTVEAGFDALRQYIERNEDMTLSAFFNKYAPKKDKNDTEKYIADAARALKLNPDDTIYEADAYEVMRFIAQHESSTPMPDIYAKRRTKAEELDARDGPSPDLSRDTPTATGAVTAGADDAEALEGIE